VTNNNGLWIRWLHLLALLYNYNQLWQLTINDCVRLSPFLTGLRVSSLLPWLTWFWFTNRSLLQHPLSAGLHSTTELPSEFSYEWIYRIHERTIFYNFERTESGPPYRTLLVFGLLSVVAETSEPLPSNRTSASVAILAFMRCLTSRCLLNGHIRHNILLIHLQTKVNIPSEKASNCSH
jgi:hypothetical protein